MSVKVLFDADRYSRHMGIATEGMPCEHVRGSIYILKSTPLARLNLVYGDEIVCIVDEASQLRFLRKHKSSEYSSFRMYAKNLVKPDKVFFEKILDQVQESGCGVASFQNYFVAEVTVPPAISLMKTFEFTSQHLGSDFYIEIKANRHNKESVSSK
jgi:hypothetical protein